MKTPIIETVIKASEILKECKLDLEKMEAEDTIKVLNQYFGTLTIETALIVAIFQLSSESQNIDREDIARFLDCNPILFFKYESNFTRLHQHKYLECNQKLRKGRFNKRSKYGISDTLHNAIIENKQFEETPLITKTDPVELLTDLADIIHERENEDINTVLVKAAFSEYVEEHSKIPLFKSIQNLDMETVEKMWMVLMAGYNLEGKTSVSIEELGETLFSKSSDKINFLNSLHEKTNILLTAKWIAFTSSGHFNYARVGLVKKAKDFFDPLGIKIRMGVVSNETQLLLPENIIAKKLFYNETETEQIASIGNSLKYRNHQKIKKRLTSQGLRTGICTILYGAPGTGKTESVYQIAKQTGRPLWKVDLSELKSMWFGESQKLVKALFDNYKALCKDQKRTPILLLNEADAILGTRKSSSESSTQTVQNAIQNIFLDCLEDFEGILFATTNLEKSLDSAFERRFLFKIKFERPKAEPQQNIWRSSLPELTKAQAKTLSETYNLSGGEIENVLRKLAMMRVLEDEVAVYESVNTLCENEQMGLKSKMTAIGYLNAI